MTRVKFSIPKATNPGASTSKVFTPKVLPPKVSSSNLTTPQSAIKASQHNSKRRVARQGSAKFEVR